MGVFFSLSRIKKDASYIVERNDDFITVDFDIKEKFFIEFIDNLGPAAEVLASIVRDESLLKETGLHDSDFLFYHRAGSFLDGENVDIFFEPKRIKGVIESISKNKEIIKSIGQPSSDNLSLCDQFLEKAIQEDNLVQFYWQ